MASTTRQRLVVTVSHSLAPSRATFLLLAAVMIAACGGQTAVAGGQSAPVAAPQLASPGVPSPSTAAIDPEPSPGSSGTAEPSAPVVVDPVPDPTPKPPVVIKRAVWSKARMVINGSCWAPVATIDGAGSFHVAARCGMGIRYATSKDGRTWVSTTLKHPAHRFDVNPQIAVDGSTLYVAFTRLRPIDGGCGDDGLADVGVYFRTRRLPGGAWSAPVRIGDVGDRLQSFRVVDGVIHETFVSKDGQGPVSYGRLTGNRFWSVRIPGAVETSLRIGDDGLARIAFSAGNKLRFASVRTDGRLSTRTIFDGGSMQVSWPNLVLGPGNEAYVSWGAHQPWGGGCADAEQPMPKPGTYFATDANGSWQVKRLASHVAPASLVVDLDDRTVHVVFKDRRSIRHFVRDAGGLWTNERVPRTARLDEVTLRQDPASSHLLLVGSTWVEDEPGSDIVAMTLS